MLPTTKDDRTWALLCHLAGLAGYVIPLGNIFGPLIIWMIKRDQSWFVDDQGKEALNFQISLTIYLIIAIISILIIVGIVLVPVVAVGGLIFMIIAAVKANEGVAYRYPLTLRLIK
ncbi:MAG: DUF4870 domain-containing protein [Acidobacteriota bacterium]